MDAYDRCTNLEKKILPMVLPSMVEAEKFSDHPHITAIKLQSGFVGPSNCQCGTDCRRLENFHSAVMSDRLAGNSLVM